MNPRRTSLLLVALALLLAAAGCGGCKGSETPAREASPLAFLPRQPQGVVHVPDLARLGQTVGTLQKTRLAELAAAAYGAKETEQLVAPLVRELGFDPRTAEGLAAAGIDGGRGLAAASDEQGAQLLVVGIADAGRFEAWVAGVAKKLGAARRGTESWRPTPPPGMEVAPAEAVDVNTFATADGAVRIAFATRDGFALVGSGEAAVDAVGRALTLPWERSLASDPVWRKMGGKLGQRDLTVWLPSGATLGNRRGTQFEKGLALGFTASAKGINARALVPRGPIELAVLSPAGKAAGGELVPLLPPGDFLALRLGGEPQALQPVIEGMLPRGLFVRLKRAGIDPAAEILGQLQPGIVVGLGLNPEIDLSAGIPMDARVSSTNPFRFVNATLYAKVKDPARAASVLEKLAAGAHHFAMEVDREERDGATIYRARYAAGEGMSWTLRGDTLVATGGAGQLEKALARLATKDAPAFTVVEPSAKQVFESSASAAHLDMPRLTAALRAIPESAYGVGGFRIKAIVETWVGLLDEVKGVTASFSVDDEGLVVDADLGLK